MQSRLLNVAVVALWLAMMGWLVHVKVLPPLRIGEPPNYRRIVEAQRDLPPVGWHVMFNERPLGWALTETQSLANGLAEIHGRVHFDTLPLEEMLPSWLRGLSQWVQFEFPTGKYCMDARSTLCIDALGRLVRFESTAQLDPLKDIIRIRGTVEGRRLHLLVRTHNTSFPTEMPLPSDAILTDALSPQSQLPGLREEQTWTVPVCNPLWPAKTPLEIVSATVKPKEQIRWNGALVDVWLVVYRSDSGKDSGESQPLRGKLWVHPDGTVLKQQMLLFESTIIFTRMPEDEAIQLANSAGQRWWTSENARRGAEHD